MACLRQSQEGPRLQTFPEQQGGRRAGGLTAQPFHSASMAVHSVPLGPVLCTAQGSLDTALGCPTHHPQPYKFMTCAFLPTQVDNMRFPFPFPLALLFPPKEVKSPGAFFPQSSDYTGQRAPTRILMGSFLFHQGGLTKAGAKGPLQPSLSFL